MSDAISDTTKAASAANNDFCAASAPNLLKGPLPIIHDEDDEPVQLTVNGRTTGRYARQCIGGLNYSC